LGGIQAAVSVLNMGGNLDTESLGNMDSSKNGTAYGSADKQTKAAGAAKLLDGYQKANTTDPNNSGDVQSETANLRVALVNAIPRGQVGAAVTSNQAAPGVSASIGSGTRVTAGTISVTATDNVTVNTTTGGGVLGLIGGYGASVSALTLNNDVSATV